MKTDLFHIRREAGLTQADAAKLCGVKQGTYSRWEKGEGVFSYVRQRLRAIWLIRREGVKRFGATWSDKWVKKAEQVEQSEQQRTQNRTEADRAI